MFASGGKEALQRLDTTIFCRVATVCGASEQVDIAGELGGANLSGK